MSDKKGGNKRLPPPPPITKSASDSDLCILRRQQVQMDLFKKKTPILPRQSQKEKEKEEEKEEEEDDDDDDEKEEKKKKPDPTQNHDINWLMSCFIGVQQSINTSLLNIMEEQKKSRKVVIRMRKEFNELKEEMKAIRFRIQTRECEKGETYRIVYDHGTKRTEYTQSLKEAVEMYMKKVMGVAVKVEEAVKVGHIGDPRDYIYAKVIESQKGGKLSVMCRTRFDSDKKKIPPKPIKKKTAQHGDLMTEPPPKIPKMEGKPAINDAAAKAIIDFLLLRMTGNTTAM